MLWQIGGVWYAYANAKRVKHSISKPSQVKMRTLKNQNADTTKVFNNLQLIIGASVNNNIAETPF